MPISFLADEINRTPPPKTQAALLEAMQERCCNGIAGHHYTLRCLPYLCVGNTKPELSKKELILYQRHNWTGLCLRFIWSIHTFKEEVLVVKNTTSSIVNTLTPILSAQEIIAIQQLIRRVPVTDNVIEYAVQLVGKTRPKSKGVSEFVQKYLDWGAGPELHRI